MACFYCVTKLLLSLFKVMRFMLFIVGLLVRVNFLAVAAFVVEFASFEINFYELILSISLFF